MSQSEKVKPQLAAVRSQLILNLAINFLAPYLVYLLARPSLASDAAALAFSGAIPVLWTVITWFWRRRVNWFGVHAVLGFGIALAITALLDGNTLLLEIHGTLLTGMLGLVLLVSLLIKRPLLLPFFQAIGQNNIPGPDLFAAAALDQSRRDRIAGRISFITKVIGLALFANLAAHVILALTLPTAAFLADSRVSTFIILGGGIGLIWWSRRMNLSHE